MAAHTTVLACAVGWTASTTSTSPATPTRSKITYPERLAPRCRGSTSWDDRAWKGWANSACEVYKACAGRRLSRTSQSAMRPEYLHRQQRIKAYFAFLALPTDRRWSNFCLFVHKKDQHILAYFCSWICWLGHRCRDSLKMKNEPATGTHANSIVDTTSLHFSVCLSVCCICDLWSLICENNVPVVRTLTTKHSYFSCCCSLFGNKPSGRDYHSFQETAVATIKYTNKTSFAFRFRFLLTF